MDEKKNVVTVAQLQSVATAQKTYIDAKVKTASDAVDTEKTNRETAISNLKEEFESKIPEEASSSDIDAIKGLFAVE